MKFPILFTSDATDFFNLGLGPMTNTLEATVTEERNGSFYFDAKVIIDDQCYPLLEENRIIRADASPELLDQRFRIKKITDNHDGTAQVYAEHVSYITQELSLKPQVTVSGTGSTAINVWKNAIIDSNPLTVDSNIPTSTMTSWRIDEVENARQALGGVKGSLLDTWGGEYRFDNYHISLLQKRGTTANVLLAYGRNITDFEQERNITDTYNSLYPYAIYSDDNQKEHLVTLPTFFVDAENIANFPNRKAFPIDFSDQFKQDEVPTTAKLKSLAQSYIKSNDIGVPKVSIKVSFVDLAKTTDYADIAPLEKLNLCDEVRVIYPKLNVNTTAKVVRVVWNVLAETYDQIEIGEKRASLSDKLNEQSQSIKEANTQANTAISASSNKNTVFYGLYGTDELGEPIANKIGDLWFKPDGEETVMLQWDGTLWRRIINTGKLTELDQAFEESNKKIEQAETNLAQAEKDIQDTQTKIDTVQNQANDLSQSIDDQNKVIELNEQIANEAKQISQTAKEASDTASNLANEAQKLADSAKTDAATAKQNASAAVSDSQTAMKNAKDALNKADSIDQTVQTEVSRINDELSSKATQTSLDSLKGTVTNQGTQIAQNKSGISLKANQTTVDNLNNTVTSQGTQINQNKNDITLKANQNTVNSLTNTVNSQGTQISQNKSDIALRATTSTVNALTGRVSTAESNININAGNITSLVSKTDGTKTKVTALEQNVEGFKTTVAQTYSTKSELNSISVGGRNLILNSKAIPISYSDNGNGGTQTVVENEYSMNTIKADGNIYTKVVISEALLANKNYVLSFEVKTEINSVSNYLWYVDNNRVPSINENTVGKWIKIVYPYTQTRDNADSILFGFTGLKAGEKIYFRNLKLEKGNKVTDWTPAPEDIDASINATNSKITTLEQNVNGFKTTVAQTYSTKSDLSSTNSKITTLEQNVNSFKTTVSETYSTKGELNTTNTKVSQISQTVSDISLIVVDKNKIVSSINLNPEGIRLKGNLIYLDGTSYISDGVITNAHIAKATILNTNIKNGTITNAEIANGTILNANIADATITNAKIKDLNADKLTAGTINAANVNIINLNANNITTGDLTGINITGSTITSQKGSSKIVLDGGALSWYTSNGIVGSIYTTEENYENFANWDVYDNGYFSIRGKGTRDGELYMRYGWGALKSIVSGMVSIISKNKYADRSTSLELNNSQVILKAGSGSGSSYRQGQIQVGAYGTSVTGGMTISGGLSVTGSKNAIHQVDGQWYATPAYETAESYLGDIGSTTTNNDSMVLISIDNLFARIVNTSLEYQVFVSSYGSGHVWVEKRTQNAFIVRSSEPNTKFAWEIKAKRKGYEQERLVKHSLIA